VSIDVLIEALYFGAVYGLVALGFTIVFAPTRVMNFAQGEALILGCAIAFQALSVWKWGLIPTFALLVFSSVVMGVIMNYLIMLPVRLSGSRVAWIIATLAAALIFQALLSLKFGGFSGYLQPEQFIGGSFKIGSATLTGQQIFTFVSALVIMFAYEQFLRRTIHGRAFRAAAHDPDTAQLMGIGVGTVTLISFVLSCLVTAVAGFAAAPLLSVAPASGLIYTFKGFTAVVIGGLGSAKGALVGGLLIGLLEVLGRAAVSDLTNPKFGAAFGNIIIAVALAVALLVFPSGFFGKPMESH
jgi:branched-chain amino acid transport system permease protein